MARKRKPGDIVDYFRRPRKGEILAHNHIAHTVDMTLGVKGFRWFSVLPGPEWVECQCGWMPEFGVHHAHKDDVEELTRKSTADD